MTVVVGAFLVVVYLCTVGSATWWDVAAGAAVASVGLHRFREFVLPHPSSGSRRGAAGVLRALVRMLIGILRSYASGTFDVLRTLRSDAEPGFVEIPLEPGEDDALAAAVLFASLSPELMLADVDRERGVIVFHAIQADAARVRRHYQQMTQTYVLPMFR